MRVTAAEGYSEQRDCLAQDWPRFLALTLPELQWLPIPNLGKPTAAFASAWGLDGFILTGGNDVGSCPLRDLTERALLELALKERSPVLGVCRGLQFIQAFFGGSLQPCPSDVHVATRHPIYLSSAPYPGMSLTRQVNSFHGKAVPAAELAAPLTVFAQSHDGWAEGVMHRDAPCLGIQWHPEREVHPDLEDQLMVRALFQTRSP
jgi:N5-(cytidine 5'-diphosphoramidyl)-L-glutamine hydrolase